MAEQMFGMLNPPSAQDNEVTTLKDIAFSRIGHPLRCANILVKSEHGVRLNDRR